MLSRLSSHESYTKTQVKTGEVRIKDNVVTESSMKESEGVSSEEKLLPWYQSAMNAAKQTEGMPLSDRMESAWRDALDGKVSMETAWKRKWSLSHVFTRISIVYHNKKSLKQQHTSHFASGTLNASSLLNNTATAAPVIQETERAYEFVDKNPYVRKF